MFLQIVIFKENELAKFYFTFFHIYKLFYSFLLLLLFAKTPNKVFISIFHKKIDQFGDWYKEKIEITGFLIIPVPQNRKNSLVLFSWLCSIKENHCSVYSELFFNFSGNVSRNILENLEPSNIFLSFETILYIPKLI